MRSNTPATDRVFHVHSVSKVYHMGDVEVHALRSVELDLLEGEFVVLLWPSGSGKSTLLNTRTIAGCDIFISHAAPNVVSAGAATRT
jgi:ABC-type Fe3+/spermidine/putrescine transport system ATPase subunit